MVERKKIFGEISFVRWLEFSTSMLLSVMRLIRSVSLNLGERRGGRGGGIFEREIFSGLFDIIWVIEFLFARVERLEATRR